MSQNKGKRERRERRRLIRQKEIQGPGYHVNIAFRVILMDRNNRRGIGTFAELDKKHTLTQ